MHPFIRFTVALFILALPLSAQYAWMHISSPRGSTPGFQGTIEDADAVCRLSGGHITTDLTLTFSTKASTVVNNDSVELTMYFSLPAGSFITDLWLWIGEDTSVAIIADRFKAQATYNTIVGARKDPALLTKQYGDEYQLRIFPFTMPGKRKIRLTYTSPLTISDSTASVQLPYWMLRASAPYTATPFRVSLKMNDWWNAPQLTARMPQPYTSVIDPVHGPMRQWEVPRDTINASSTLMLTVSNAARLRSKYGEKFQTGNSGTYRFVVEPFASLGINTGKRVLFLMDFDSTNVIPTFSKADLLRKLKIALRTKLTAKDSFNVIFTSRQGMTYLRPGWIPADSGSIEFMFNSVIEPGSLLDTVDLSGLLVEGFRYARTSGTVSGVVLVSSSDQYFMLSAANKLIDSLAGIAPATMRFFAIDNNDSSRSYYSSGYYYSGNSYLYSQLASRFNGASYKIQNYPEYVSIDYYLEQIMTTLRWQIEYFGLNVHLKDGFTYQNYYSLGRTTNIGLNTIVSQVGKYTGSFPMTIDITGFYEGKLYGNRIVMEDSDFIPADTMLNKVWAANMLGQFNNYWSRNEQAIALSMENRILTNWTAFLALEKGQKLCDTCIAFGGSVVVTDVDVKQPAAPEDYEIIRAYPNPFNPSTTLRVRLPEGISPSQSSLMIVNILGQTVRTFSDIELSEWTERSIMWNGRDDRGAPVASGVYLAVLTTPNKRYNVKLLLMK